MTLNKCAEEIEKYQRFFINLKANLILKVKYVVKNPLSDKEIEEYMNRIVQELLNDN